MPHDDQNQNEGRLLGQVCELCNLSRSVVVQFVREERVYPINPDQEEEGWLFDAEDLARLNLIRDLREELGVNDEAIPIILHLVDQLNSLRSLAKKAA